MEEALFSDYQSRKPNLYLINAKDLKKSRLRSNKQKLKIKPELKITKSKLLSNLQTFKQKFLSANGFIIHR